MILVVDDDRALRELASAVLERDGHDVLAVASTGAALTALQLCHVDLVVSDLNMPGGSGLDLLATLRARGNGVPFVLITASDPAEHAPRAAGLGVAATLRKPFALAALSGAVATVLAGRGATRSSAPPPPRAA